MDRKNNLADLEGASERLFRQLAELHEIAKKKGAEAINNLNGIENLATSVGKMIGSIPEQKDSYYIDTYHQQMAQEKLDKEIASIRRRVLRIGLRISNVNKEIAEREKLAMQFVIHPGEGYEKSAKRRKLGKKQKPQMRYEYQEEE